MGQSRRAFVEQVAGTSALAGLAGVSPAALAVPAADLGAGRAADDEAYWRWVAGEFLTAPNVAHMNTGTRGVSPRSVVQAQFNAIKSYDSDYLSHATYACNGEFRDRLRAKLAAFIGCQPNEVALTNNTTEGMAFGTLGLDFRPGDEIIHTNHDHPSGVAPIHLCAARYGIKPVVVDLRGDAFHPPKHPSDIVAAFEKAMTKRTRLISFCHINYTDGCVLPVREICALARERGILTLVDGAHPPGMMQLNIAELGCDMYAGAGHKWLLASMLTGFFHVREDVQDRVWPLVYSGPVAGRNMHGRSVADTEQGKQAATAARYEMRGSRDFAALAAFDAALDFHIGLTPAAIEARGRHLAARVRAGLRAIDGVRVHVSDNPKLSGSLVSFHVEGVEPKAVNQRLWERHRLYIRDVAHPEIGWNVNRASLHIMVHGGHVDTLLGAIEEIAHEARA